VIACRAKRSATIVDCALCRRRRRSSQSWFQFRREANLYMTLFAMRSSSLNPPKCFRHLLSKLFNRCSAVGINLRPARIHFLPLLLCSLSVLCCSVQSLRAQTHVHVVFEVCAHAHSLPQKALGLALVERGHDLFTAWNEVVRRRLSFEGVMSRGHTDIILGV
jgi:hypothetical protein